MNGPRQSHRRNRRARKALRLAWKRSGQAVSLKSWARNVLGDRGVDLEVRQAANRWLERKGGAQ